MMKNFSHKKHPKTEIRSSNNKTENERTLRNNRKKEEKRHEEKLTLRGDIKISIFSCQNGRNEEKEKNEIELQSFNMKIRNARSCT